MISGIALVKQYSIYLLVMQAIAAKYISPNFFGQDQGKRSTIKNCSIAHQQAWQG
ncbi:hypothetical protein [Scytonema sp. NUACC26]|uniref:hypothetical protein n=1 Tax=Scytonema sp. NUACC26 TaxID=3140176 RepID=UPI0038B3238F